MVPINHLSQHNKFSLKNMKEIEKLDRSFFMFEVLMKLKLSFEMMIQLLHLILMHKS